MSCDSCKGLGSVQASCNSSTLSTPPVSIFPLQSRGATGGGACFRQQQQLAISPRERSLEGGKLHACPPHRGRAQACAGARGRRPLGCCRGGTCMRKLLLPHDCQWDCTGISVRDEKPIQIPLVTWSSPCARCPSLAWLVSTLSLVREHTGINIVLLPEQMPTLWHIFEEQNSVFRGLVSARIHTPCFWRDPCNACNFNH